MVESPAVNVAFKDKDRSSSNGELLPLSLRLPLPPNDRKAAFEDALRDPWLRIKNRNKIKHRIERVPISRVHEEGEYNSSKRNASEAAQVRT